MAPGTVLNDRYRLESGLSDPDPVQGCLWLGKDLLAGEIPVVIRQLLSADTTSRFQRHWPLLQSLLHPQLPRFGELLEAQGAFWAVRDWQDGSGFDQILEQRRERQLVFGPGEVLLLLRQILPVLAVLHGRGVVHGDVNPRNLLRRHSDGLPVLLDFGLVQADGEAPLPGASPGYAPRAQGRQESCAAWMDLHGLGVTALVLLTGQAPESLIAVDASDWSWPDGLDVHSAFRSALERLLSEDPQHRFAAATEVLQALEAVPMPDSTGPIARSDRTVVLAPAAPDLPDLKPVFTDPAASSSPGTASAQPRRLSRAEEREQGAEGRLWPVVAALVLSALVGTAIGWYLLSRGASKGTAPSTSRDVVGRAPSVSLPPAEVDERRQLLSRLRALQVDRSWFLKLVDSSLLSRFPERGGRLPSDSLEDAPLRRVWNDLAEEWLARIEQLPPGLRSKLGQLNDADWRQQQQVLEKQGVHPRVVEQLVSAAARNLLPGDSQGRKPPEPYRQLWYAAAVQSLADVKIETLVAKPRQATNLSLRIPAGGARLIAVAVPSGYGLVMGINGTPLMQMTIYGSEGQVETERGPLRVVTLPAEMSSPVQVLVTNEGVASGLLTLSCRADQPKRPVTPAPVRPELRPPLPNPIREPDPALGPDLEIPTEPVPDSATGAPMQPEPLAPTEQQPSMERPSIEVPLVPDDET
ncbi:protein kinase [Synechococcus sp. CC9616]|uniref:serine/threonine protein kinase n=1 Tax=Synechococcus sp. CC9616 TaxID=110663 RepID=UPI0004B4067B|nr:protein kinase [Synechococcus sp. CC9616]